MAPPTVHGARLALALAAAAVMAAAGGGPALAQGTGVVRGHVTDAATGRSLTGAQVALQGTRRGALADDQGAYIIRDVPPGTYTVHVENLGFKAVDKQATVQSDATATVNFTMAQEAIAMNELVVTGTVGRTTKRAIGNSVSTVQASKITEAAPIQNVQELLTARTPGVTIMSNSGQAGSASKIRIRGAGSLSAGLEPVIYVDGIRVSNGVQDGYNTGGGLVQGTSALDAINPEDIESIQVIKGPAAATLYGADAAPGVIQIITKKGRMSGGGVKWTAAYEQGQTAWHVGNPINYWLCTPSEIANTATYPGCSQFDPNSAPEQRLLVDNPLRRNTNALRTGGQYDLNLSARGGGENYNFYLSGERSNEEGVFYNNYARRTSGRANFGFVPSEKLNFNASVAYAQTHEREPLANNASNSVLRNGLRGRAGAADDPYEFGFKGFGPELANQYDNQTFGERTTIGLTTNYNTFPWLQQKLTVGLDKQDRLNRELYTIDQTGKKPWGSTVANGAVYRYIPTTHVWTVDYNATATARINANYNSATSFGMQYNDKKYEWDETIGEGFVADKLNLVSSAATTRAGQGLVQQTSLGFFGQEQLSFKDRLYGTAAVRIDNNSAFGDNFSLVVYPKASLSYVISDEKWFHLPAVNELKLRAAWGEAGNAPDPFTADRTYTSAITTISEVPANQLTSASYGNPDLQAETGQEVELGFDGSLLNGRAGIEFTYYNQQTKDALVQVPDPRSVGFTGSHYINIGQIANNGLELALTGTPIHTRAVSWDAHLSLSTNHNKLVSFGRNPDGTPVLDEITFGAFASVQRHREGYPLGGFWATDVQRDASGNPVLDANGRAIVQDHCVWPPQSAGDCQEIYMGPMLPTREASFANTVTLFGNLQLFANLDYKGGNYQWCAICSIRSRIDRNTYELNDPSAGTSDAQKAVLLSLQTKTWIMPADFLKLRELSATYTLPNSWAHMLRVERAAFTLSARNFWMWTKYKGTADPEVTFYSRSNFTQLDYASTPMTRRLMASLRVSF